MSEKEKDKTEITEKKDSDNQHKKWSDILLGNQFLKLYFYENGISNSLIVDRLIRFEDLRMKKGNEKFKFAIIKSKENEKNIDINNSNDSEEKKSSFSRLEYETYEDTFEKNKFLFFVRIYFLYFIVLLFQIYF